MFVLPGDSSTVGLATVAVLLDGDLDLPQSGWLVAARAGCSPPRHGGLPPAVQLAGGAGQTGGAHRGAELDWLGQGQDGEVVVQIVAVVVGVVGDLGEADPGEQLVVNPVLAHQDGDGADVGAGRAVSSSEDVAGGDESSSTEGVTSTS